MPELQGDLRASLSVTSPPGAHITLEAYLRIHSLSSTNIKDQHPVITASTGSFDPQDIAPSARNLPRFSTGPSRSSEQ